MRRRLIFVAARLAGRGEARHGLEAQRHHTQRPRGIEKTSRDIGASEPRCRPFLLAARGLHSGLRAVHRLCSCTDATRHRDRFRAVWRGAGSDAEQSRRHTGQGRAFQKFRFHRGPQSHRRFGRQCHGRSARQAGGHVALRVRGLAHREMQRRWVLFDRERLARRRRLTTYGDQPTICRETAGVTTRHLSAGG